MTAPLQPPTRPPAEPAASAALSPGQATLLLDQLLYEQVLACVDLDQLYHLEQSLTLMIGQLDDVTCDDVGETARSMLDRALLRLPDDLRRYLRSGPLLFDHCELCEEETKLDRPPMTKPKKPRPKS